MDRLPKLDRAELCLVRLPLIKPFETSFGVQTHREALLIRLEAGGLAGWGECTAGSDPFYSYETHATARLVIREYLLPMLRQRPVANPAEAAAVFHRVRGHPMAKATVEGALWDLWARQRGLPLGQVLGGRPMTRVRSGISLGLMDQSADLLAAVEDAVGRGYHRVKLKIKRGRDRDVLAPVRARFPDLNLMADANADYTLADADHLAALDDLGLMMLEQPLDHDDLFEHAQLQRRLRTPICLDESIPGPGAARAALDMASGRVINIKQGRVGGLTAAIEVAALCAARGVPVWSGGMLETGIGRAVNIHLQTVPGFDLPGDTSETARYFEEDIADPPVVLDGEGYIAVPPGPGLGVEIRPERLARRLVWREDV